MECLCQSHRDCHPFMPQHGTEASLSSAAGTSCAAACIAFDVHQQPLKFHTKGNKGAALGWERLVVVVVVVVAVVRTCGYTRMSDDACTRDAMN